MGNTALRVQGSAIALALALLAGGAASAAPATCHNTGSFEAWLDEASAALLTEADLNLKIGAAYMAQQLKDFDNSIFAAFAAYNAGPNAASSWYKAAKNDGDEFLEQVEFSETRLYIRNVSENYAIYRYLYGGEDAPSLPSD